MEDISVEHLLVPGENREFRAILLPHRSLDRKGFMTVMLLISGGSFAACLAFVIAGVWPVAGIFMLDLLLIYGAFRLSYRDARRHELIELAAGEQNTRELRVTRVLPSGRRHTWSFNPYWVRVDLEEWGPGGPVLTLRQHSRKLVIGAFLTGEEKREFAAVLRGALAGRGE
jgi:uncharacterized membrane protein